MVHRCCPLAARVHLKTGTNRHCQHNYQNSPRFYAVVYYVASVAVNVLVA